MCHHVSLDKVLIPVQVSTARLKDNAIESTRYLSRSDGTDIKHHIVDQTKTVDNSLHARNGPVGKRHSRGPCKGPQNVDRYQLCNDPERRDGERFKSTCRDVSRQGGRGQKPNRQRDGTQSPRLSRPYKQNGRADQNNGRVKAAGQRKTSDTSQSVLLYQKKFEVSADKPSLLSSAEAILDTTSTKEQGKEDEKKQLFIPQSKFKTTHKDSDYTRKRPQKPSDRNFYSKRPDNDLRKESDGPPSTREASEI